MLECVVNVSEGRDAEVLGDLAAAAGDDLLDVHTDPHHHRTVLTLVGEDAPRAVAALAVARLDLRGHDGVHPRLGVVDVVPFVPLEGSTLGEAQRARHEFGRWFADAYGVPCFTYGPERTLPELRRQAFRTLGPTMGPATPHPTAGATAVGARPILVAFNVWLDGDLTAARAISAAIRRPELRTLGLAVGPRVQVSMNLVAPDRIGPAAAFDLVDAAARDHGARAEGAELVGLVPASVLADVPAARRAALDLSDDRTIEARLAARR